jgi:hypothetical protein
MIADYTGFQRVPPILEMKLPANIQLSTEPRIVIVIFHNILDLNRLLFQLLPLLMLLFKRFKATIGFYAGGTLRIVILVAIFFACVGVLIAYAHFLTRAQYRTDYGRRLRVAAVSSRP